MVKMINSNQMVPILLNLLAAVCGAFGQYFYKMGGLKINSVPIYKNWALFVGMILFCLVMILFVAAFKLGGRISVVYPAYATTFAWGILIAVVIGREPWSVLQVLGIAVIIFGICLVAMGGAR